MAERRMFAKSVIGSDNFLDMPATTQLLYFHLGMCADDDGFVGNPRSIMRMTGAGEDDLKLLCVKKFIIPFNNGIVLISHWKVNNYIQKDRYHETIYREQKAMISSEKSGVYTSCIHSGYEVDTQASLGKARLGGNPVKDCPTNTGGYYNNGGAALRSGPPTPEYIPEFPVEDNE